MPDHAVDLLRRLSDTPGAPGAEHAVRGLLAAEWAGLPLRTDRTGSVLCELAGTAPAPRIMLEAHLDEVAFAVRLVTPEGFVKFTTLGGWWGHSLLAQRVAILTRDGTRIAGVITSKPPHFLSEAERNVVLKPDQMYVDVGASSADEARSYGIRPGDAIVPDVACTRLHNPDLLLGKAFDNRVGTALLVQTIQHLARVPHPNTVIGVGAVQEEVGTRGARTAAALAQPDLAIVLEGTPADDTPGCVLSESQGALGKGPQIRILDPTAIMNRPLVDYIADLATSLKLPFQLAVRTSGGTDAGAIHLHGIGVPTVVIGVPARYIHTHHSLIHVQDYRHTLSLLTALLTRLDAATVATFTDFLG